jgi:uncharacterized protein (DUF952 family)
MSIILHISTEQALHAGKSIGEYTAPSLVDEGFIHCSTAEQIAATANRFYAGQAGLIVLHIDTETLKAEVKWEEANGQLFPHIYGPINLDAIVEMEDFEPDARGEFHYR